MKSKTYTQNKQPLDKTQSSKFFQLGVKQTRFQNLKKKRKWFFDHSTTLTIWTIYKRKRVGQRHVNSRPLHRSVVFVVSQANYFDIWPKPTNHDVISELNKCFFFIPREYCDVPFHGHLICPKIAILTQGFQWKLKLVWVELLTVVIVKMNFYLTRLKINEKIKAKFCNKIQSQNFFGQNAQNSGNKEMIKDGIKKYINKAKI